MKCPECGKNVKGRNANNRKVRCEVCGADLPLAISEAGLDAGGQPVAQPAPIEEPKAPAGKSKA